MSKVFKSITKPQLLLMLPKDYLILLACSSALVFNIVWVFLIVPKLVAPVYSWGFFLVFIGLGWGIGAIKAKYDPEFLSVHISKIQIPARSFAHRVDRYINSINID